MVRTLFRRGTAIAVTALLFAAHLPLPAGAAAAKMACCGPKACCQPERACTSGGACANHSDPAGAPVGRTLPSLVAGNCADPIPRVVPVSYDPATQPSANAIRTEAPLTVQPAMPAPTVLTRDLSPSVPPPRA